MRKILQIILQFFYYILVWCAEKKVGDVKKQPGIQMDTTLLL